MRVEVARPAQSHLSKLPPDVRLKILQELQALGKDPFPGAPKSKRLAGLKVPTFRLRIGDYRAVYRIIEDVIVILAIVARKDLDRVIRSFK